MTNTTQVLTPINNKSQPVIERKVQSADDIDYSAIPKQQRWNTIQYVTVGLGVATLFTLFITIIH